VTHVCVRLMKPVRLVVLVRLVAGAGGDQSDRLLVAAGAPVVRGGALDKPVRAGKLVLIALAVGTPDASALAVATVLTNPSLGAQKLPLESSRVRNRPVDDAPSMLLPSRDGGHRV